MKVAFGHLILIARRYEISAISFLMQLQYLLERDLRFKKSNFKMKIGRQILSFIIFIIIIIIECYIFV